MKAILTIARLTPTPWRTWRCRCGNRHDHQWILCPYTNLPRDLR